MSSPNTAGKLAAHLPRGPVERGAHGKVGIGRDTGLGPVPRVGLRQHIGPQEGIHGRGLLLGLPGAHRLRHALGAIGSSSRTRSSSAR